MKSRSILALLAWALFVTMLPAADPAATPLVGHKTDIEFARVGDVSLTLDAFVPEGKGPFMTCILVHGGGFMRGDKQSYIKPLFEPLSKAGFAWFTINYRLAPQHRWPACADDVATAIRWVRAHAKEYKVDPSRIALIGESAGGHLVSWAGVHGQGNTSVAAVVPFYAPHDLEMQVDNRGELGPSMVALLGLTELNDAARVVLREASPARYIHAGLPPFLLIHGDADAQVPYRQSTVFQQWMRAAGNRCDLIHVPSGAHGMGGWQKLGSDYQEQLIAWLNQALQKKLTLALDERRAQMEAAFNSPDAAVRRIAVRSLPHNDVAPLLMPQLQASLKDVDPEVREWAATVLGPQGVASEGAVAQLILQLKNDPEKKCRETAARALGRIGKAVSSNRQMIAPLEAAGSSDRDSVTRVVALGALALIEPDSAARIAAVRPYVTHEDSLTRMKAAHALGYLGERAAAAGPNIAQALAKATEPHERGYLARALGQIGDRQQLPVLLAELAKERNERALGEMRGAARRLGASPEALKSP